MGVIQNSINQALGVGAALAQLSGRPQELRAIKKEKNIVTSVSNKIKELDADKNLTAKKAYETTTPYIQELAKTRRNLYNMTGKTKYLDAAIKTEGALDKAYNQYNGSKFGVANERVDQARQFKQQQKSIYTSMGNIGPDNPLYDRIKKEM